MRFFLVSRKADTEFVFDIDLALAQSEENPVYYVQIRARARLQCVPAAARERPERTNGTLARACVEMLAEPHEKALIRRLTYYPELLETAARELEPHQLAHYLRELAGDFHAYYNAHNFIVDDVKLRNARLNLVRPRGR